MKDNRWLKKKNLKVEIVRKRKYNNRSGGFSSKVHSSDIRHSEVLMQKHKEKETALTMICWTAKIDCFCIFVDLIPFFPN